MTRINCVPVQELEREHLIAEYRELPRVFSLARAALARGEAPDDPQNPIRYTLGKGHCRFFYSRLGWLRQRQAELVAEMIRRGYRPAHTETAHMGADMPRSWLRGWVPDADAVEINRARIADRLGVAA